jgi:GH15 family glucan-1,4-alpha-glucosidase
LIDGEFVLRDENKDAIDGLPPGEGAFLACSFWLVDNYVLQARHAEARRLFERLLARCNQIGPTDERAEPNIAPATVSAVLTQ